MRPRSSRLPLLAFLSVCVAGAAGCDSEAGLLERRAIHDRDVPAALRVVRQDLNNVSAGVREAAQRMRRGFLVTDAERQEREIRQVLRRLQLPPRSVNGLMVSPITFVAAVGMDGKVIARDAEPDHLRGMDLAEVAPVVQRALDGEAGYALSQLPNLEEGGRPSVTVIFAAPAVHEGRVVGAIAAGLPLWRIAQQLCMQLRLENMQEVERGELVWALLYQGDRLHYHQAFPPDLREFVPDEAARAAGLGASPGGYTGEFQQYGRWYGYGVLPLPTLGDDVGIVFFRSNPS